MCRRSATLTQKVLLAMTDSLGFDFLRLKSQVGKCVVALRLWPKRDLLE